MRVTEYVSKWHRRQAIDCLDQWHRACVLRAGHSGFGETGLRYMYWELPR